MIKEGVFLGKRYEILGRIGSGGMADVYKGKDHKLNRFVAIKVLKSTYRSDETFIKKFLSEAQAAAGLMHPNVVNVYDVGQDLYNISCHFFFIKYLDHSIITDQRLDPVFSKSTLCFTFKNSGFYYIHVVESGNPFYYLSLHILALCYH